MGLFKPDLYRAFAIGFLIGAAVLWGSLGEVGRDRFAARVIPSAVAAAVK